MTQGDSSSSSQLLHAGTVQDQAEGAASGEAAVDEVSRDDLNLCDVLLYRRTNLISRAIQFFDGTEVSHSGLYLGDADHSVEEAIGEGLVRRPLSVSVAGAEWVLVRRLKDLPTDMTPVRRRGEHYLAQGNRYAYEQMLLLAFMTLIRKPKVTPIFKQAVVGVLNAASSFLLRLASMGRQPMICSELVYRAYDEALPDALDRYSLRIGGSELESMVGFAPKKVGGQGIHPDSLLGQTAIRAELLEAVPSPESVPRQQPAAERSLESYLREAKGPVREPKGFREITLVDAQTTAAIQSFAVALYQAAAPPAAERSFKAQGVAPESTGLPAALQHLYRTAADFVTPGDLLKTQSFLSVGRLRA